LPPPSTEIQNYGSRDTNDGIVEAAPLPGILQLMQFVEETLNVSTPGYTGSIEHIFE